jgi:hypothetical protein
MLNGGVKFGLRMGMDGSSVFLRHPEVPARSAGLEGRRPVLWPFILRGSLRSHLRMTGEG